MKIKYTPKIGLIILFALFNFSSFSYPVSAEGQVAFKLVPDKQSYLNAQFFYLDIQLDTANQIINAINLGVIFPTDNLELLAIDYEQSFCSFFINDSFDNSTGTLHLSCATSEPSASGTLSVARLVFTKKLPGLAKFSFTDDSVALAHNGFGTNLLESTEIHSIYIK